MLDPYHEGLRRMVIERQRFEESVQNMARCVELPSVHEIDAMRRVAEAVLNDSAMARATCLLKEHQETLSQVAVMMRNILRPLENVRIPVWPADLLYPSHHDNPLELYPDPEDLWIDEADDDEPDPPMRRIGFY